MHGDKMSVYVSSKSVEAKSTKSYQVKECLQYPELISHPWRTQINKIAMDHSVDAFFSLFINESPPLSL